MKFYVGFTDQTWFDNLSEINPDEVNFWRPGGEGQFKALNPGELLLFKLKKPNHFIVGGGFFTRSSILPVSLAWDIFGIKNGRASFSEFRSAINAYRKKKGKEEQVDPFIGCVVLTSPFFLPREDWIPAPENWSTHIVQGKLFDEQQPEGLAIWEQLQDVLLSSTLRTSTSISPVAVEAARSGQPRMVTPRLGQGSFRVSVTESYMHRCAMTGEKTLPVLEAAHIRPFAQEGPHLTSNGLLLRADLHTLFDRGLMTITSDNRIEVSNQIKETYGNGRHYYALHGQELQIVPKAVADRPSPEFVEWHNNQVFRP